MHKSPQKIAAALYLRLSREDESAHESASIANQKSFLADYANQKGWPIKEIYIDDGWSGTSFERPGFQKMIADIRSKKINLILTKDLSRLGRDYIGTGYYLEKFFPENDVRYIALSDGIDTFENSANNDMTPFRSVINDMYAKDISKKVRAVLDNKRQKGQFIGAFAPYGYEKNPQNKSQLIINEETASTVRQIFRLFLQGHGYLHIANTLNRQGIPSPAVYKSQNSTYKNPKSKNKLWTHETIKSILTNPTYAGNITQGKYTKVSYKSKKQKNIPRAAWLTVENTHTPIIDIQTFELAQSLLQRKCGYDDAEKNRHLLTGLLYCGDCGERMTFHKIRGSTYCVCSKYRRFGKTACSIHSVKETDIEAYILTELRHRGEAVADKEKLKEIEEASKYRALHTFNNEADFIQRRLEEIRQTIKSLYEDKLRGVVSERDFIDLCETYSRERETLQAKVVENEGKITEEEAKGEKSRVESLLSFEAPEKSVLSTLIEKIEVFDHEKGQKVFITYRFKDAL